MNRSPDAGMVESFVASEKLVLNFGRLLLIGMMSCLAIGLQRVGEKLATGWDGSYLPWMAALVALDAVWTAGQVRRARTLELSVPLYRLVEWVVILALVRLFFFIRDGLDALWSALSFDGTAWLEALFNPEFVLTALALLLLWLVASWTMHDLFEIESALDLLNAEGYERYFSNTSEIRRAIAQRLFGIGLLLVVVSGLVGADWRRLFSGAFSPPQFQTWYVLAYFVLLILLLGQTYFSTLRAGWAWERIQIDRRIARRWLGFGLLALLLIGGIVSLLPTRYSLGFLQTLQLVLGWVLGFLVAIFMYLALIMSYAMAWLFSLFGSGEPPEQPEVEQIMPFEPVEEVFETATGSEIVQSLAFWIFLSLLVFFAFYQYLRQNKALFGRLKLSGLFQGLGSWFDWLRGWAQGARRQVGEALAEGLQRLRAGRSTESRQEAFRFTNPNRLPPRQRVLFYYLALVRRGEEAGVPRRAGETPAEYEQSLQAHFERTDQPADPVALEELTQAFQEARYSRHEITPEQVFQVRSAWERLRQLLRGKNERNP